MKQTDIDRLKSICEKEGFFFDWDHVDHSAIIIREKKDPWEGVEFCQEGHLIYRIHKICDNQVYYYDKISDGSVWSYKTGLKPSTEAAYIDQLKKEAFERFGEIREGDRFDRKAIDFNWPTEKMYDSELGFRYKKSYDTLYFGGLAIYRSGKWAKKLPERVKVGFVGFDVNGNYLNVLLEVFGKNNYPNGIGEHLSKCLEDYLNKEAGL